MIKFNVPYHFEKGNIPIENVICIFVKTNALHENSKKQDN